jgi:acyl-CoA synthetase (NDP forming)
MKAIHYFMLFLMCAAGVATQLAGDPHVGQAAQITASVATALLGVLAHISPSAIPAAPVAPAPVVPAPVTPAIIADNPPVSP